MAYKLQAPDSTTFQFGDAMAKVLDHPRKKKSVMSVNKVQQKEFPATHWANAVAMLRAMNTPVTPESGEPSAEEFSVSDFDIVRARRLSSRIR